MESLFAFFFLSVKLNKQSLKKYFEGERKMENGPYKSRNKSG